ncbi:MAG TPA: globin domain-containing protein [Burkholderiaceae bacterium]
MDLETIGLVRSSWRLLGILAPQAGALFYRNLFAADPMLVPLFKGDINEQGRKLMLMVDTAVSHLDDFSGLMPLLRALGQRHAGYGVEEAHYDSVGAALLLTLEEGLGEAFTPAAREAWSRSTASSPAS